jgi:hypothetical protein
MQYVRVYVDPDGESHFEDVDVPMQAVTTVTGVSTSKGHSGPIGDALTFTRVDPADASVGQWGVWHPDPNRQFVVWLEGEIEIEVSDGEVRQFGPGRLLLLEDTTGKGHRNRRLSADMRSIFIPLAPTASA